jgi:hypothetical protein
MATDDSNAAPAKLTSETPIPKNKAPGWRSRLLFGLVGAMLGGALVYGLLLLCVALMPLDIGGHGVSITDLIAAFFFELSMMGLTCLTPVGAVLGAFIGASFLPRLFFAKIGPIQEP